MNTNYFYFLILFVILLIPDIILNYSDDLISTISYKILFLISLISLIQIFTKSYFKTFILVGIPYLISMCIETINVILFSTYSTLDIVKGIFNTLDSEINEFFNRFYLYLAIPVIAIALYLFTLNKIKNTFVLAPKKNRLFISSIICLILSLSIINYKLSKTAIYVSGKNIPKYALMQYLIKQHPFSIYYRFYELGIYRNRVEKYSDIKNNFKFGVNNKNSKSSPDIVVFIIGERIRYENWSINGYPKETSPGLSKINNLITFNNNYSNANSTANSIPLLITQGTPNEFSKVYSEKTIVSLYKEAGYKTYWISSQANCFDFIDNKDEMDVLFEIYDRPKHTDLDIIPSFKKILSDNSFSKKFIVINMLGGHGKVPRKFLKFSPNGKNNEYNIKKENLEIITNDYNNMIIFQDYIISQLINKIKKTNSKSILLFSADHATNLFNDKNNIFGYGSAIPNEEEIKVPLFIWGSNKYVNDENIKFDHLRSHKNIPTSNTNIFYTLADLSNIQYSTFKSELSLSSPLYQKQNSRYVFVNNSVFEFKNK